MESRKLLGYALLLSTIILLMGCTQQAPVEVDVNFHADMLFAEVSIDQVCLAQGNDSLPCAAMAPLTDDRTMKHAVELGDVDGDGDLDAIFASDVIRAGDDHFSCLNQGDGTFECITFFSDGYFSEDIALGDVDGDGDLDAVLPSRILDPESEIKENYNRVCLGDGRGRFGCQRLSEDFNSSRGVALGDVNQDGYLDAVFANDKENTLCLGQGDASFVCQFMSENAVTSNAVQLGDFNLDGKLDAIFANSKKNHICLQKDNVEFDCNQADKNSDDHSADVALGDFNGDGQLDAIFANDWRQTSDDPPRFKDGVANRVCLGNRNGSFKCEPVSDDEFYTSGVALADLNNDGHLDAVFANFRSNVTAAQGQRNRSCFGNGQGRFLCVDVNSQVNFSLDVAIGKLTIDE